jgi:hypothetical protein
MHNKLYESDEVLEFRIKENDIIYYDPKFNVFKVHFEHFYEKKPRGSKTQDAEGHTVKIIKLRFRIECNS